jgi:hypothetical protein
LTTTSFQVAESKETEDLMFRIILGVSALTAGISIAFANLFFYHRLKELKNALGHVLFKSIWTGKSSRAGEGIDRTVGLLFGLFFVVWGILILTNRLN